MNARINAADPGTDPGGKLLRALSRLADFERPIRRDLTGCYGGAGPFLPLTSLPQTIFIRSNPRGFGRERDIDGFLNEIQGNCPDGRYHNGGDTGDNEATHRGRPPRIIV
jgi:hypothetical protein